MAPIVARELEIVYGSIEVADVEAGNGVYNLEAAQPTGWIRTGSVVFVYGASNAANNGLHTVVSLSGTKLTTDNASSVLEASSPAKVGVLIGGASDFMPDSVVRIGDDPDRASVDFTFAYQEDDEDVFVTQVRTVEEALKTPYQRLSVTNNGKPLILLDPSASSNTGFNARARLSTEGDFEVNGARSRRWRVSFGADLPADLYARDGRRNSAFTVDLSPNEKARVTFEGEWTPQGTEDSALAQYDANVDAWVDSVMSALGIAAHEQTGETKTPDETDSIVQFRRVQEEILSPQSNAGLDDTDVKKHRVFIGRVVPAPGDSPTADRLTEITARYDAWVKKGVDPLTKYNASIRSFLIERALTKFGASSGALVNENATIPDENENQLGVELRILARIGASSRISFTDTIKNKDEKGPVFLGGWTGDPLSYYRFQGHRRITKTLIQTERVHAGESGGGGGGGVGGIVLPGGQANLPPQAQQGAAGNAPNIPDPPGVSGGEWVELLDDDDETPFRLGRNGYVIDVVDKTRTRLFQYIKEIEAPSTSAVATQAAGGPPGAGAQGGG